MQDFFVPITILTGFLGSGKTTFLNRILTELHGQRIAVIVNEFGEVNIDSLLIQTTSENIIELNNGCICCSLNGQSMRSDLITALDELKTRRELGLYFDRVIIETSGLAEPIPIAQTMLGHPDLGRTYRLDSVLALVDAKCAWHQLDEFATAQHQVGFADCILISKTDLVDELDVNRLTRRLQILNPRAAVRILAESSLAIDALLNMHGFDMSPTLNVTTHNFHHPHHDHEVISSFVLKFRDRVEPAALDKFLIEFVPEFAESLLRYKGVLWVGDDPDPIVIQGLQALVSVAAQQLRPDSYRPTSCMVIIARNNAIQTLKSRLKTCFPYAVLRSSADGSSEITAVSN